VQLILAGYLTESFQATAYTVNVYVVPGPAAPRLLRCPLDAAQSLADVMRLVLVGTEPRAKRPRVSATPKIHSQD